MDMGRGLRVTTSVRNESMPSRMMRVAACCARPDADFHMKPLAVAIYSDCRGGSDHSATHAAQFQRRHGHCSKQHEAGSHCQGRHPQQSSDTSAWYGSPREEFGNQVALAMHSHAMPSRHHSSIHCLSEQRRLGKALEVRVASSQQSSPQARCRPAAPARTGRGSAPGACATRIGEPALHDLMCGTPVI